MGDRNRPRVLMIGVDAAEFSFIQSSIHKFPTFQRLLHEGTLFRFRSSAEHIPASVWPTMYTGKSAGYHGITQHIQWDPASMRMRRISSDWVYCEPFWYDLARAGLGVTVLDVPFLFENKLPEAVEIINWGSHDLIGKFGATKDTLRSEILKRFGGHPMGYEIPVSKNTEQLVAMKKECVEGAEIKGKLSRWLRETTNWEFFLTVFGECHRAGHIMWRDHDEVHSHVPPGALLEVYEAVDAAIATTIEGVDLQNTTVVVFALHGMGFNFSQEHFVRRAMDRINATFFQEKIAGDNPIPKQRGVIRMLRESIPAPLQHAIARSVPVEVRDYVVSREVTGGLDWKKTPGFALRSDLYSFLRLNVSGREQQGILEPGSASYRKYIDHLIESFLGLRGTQTNIPVVSDVVLLQELYPGVRQHLLPDLLLRWKEDYPIQEVNSDSLGVVVAAPDSGRTGEHRPNGFAIVLGRGREGGLPALTHNSDFPEFVSHLLGIRSDS